MTDQSSLQPFPPDARLRITPTDVAQFIRLDQCQRFLRLRMVERVHGQGFMREMGLRPQDPPPLMMKGGADFEQRVYDEMRSAGRAILDLRLRLPRGKDDGAAVREIAGRLERGTERNLIQPRLSGSFGGWEISGDVDLLQLRRDPDGRLHALIADIKSSQTSKVEHRLQIAFYARLLRALLPELAGIELGVLYKGSEAADEELPLRHDAERAFGTSAGYLERVADPQPYLDAVSDLVTGEASVARRILSSDFDDVPFHLTYRCDWCRFNPFCMRWAAERDDLSLIPYLSETDKGALNRAGVRTARQMSALKSEGPDGRLIPDPRQAELAARLSTTWPVGARLDELIHRARRYRKWKGDPVDAPQQLPHRGYGTLPYCDAEQNPNLIRVYVDAQQDTQSDQVYMIGALVAAAEHGVLRSERRRAIVHCARSVPSELNDERDLLLGWIQATLQAVVELAAPDAAGEKRAPLHLIFFNRFDQELFLDALARHAATILSATPLFDFVTQLAAFDSPVATFLVDEIRELRNYPMMSQSLQSVARFLRFDWNSPRPFTTLFKERLFDYAGKFDEGDPTAPGGSPWYTSRSRFNSQIPLEYAHAAWGALPDVTPGDDDPFAPYRAVTLDDLEAFQLRRLEAMEHIAADFEGNKLTQKTPFLLPDLDQFDEKAQTLAQALLEFNVIERHVELAGWKTARLLPPERRVLAGESMLTVYRESDQQPGVAELNCEAERRRLLQEQMRADFRAANPEARQVRLTAEQKALSDWSLDGVEFRLEVAADRLDCSLQEAIDLNSLDQGSAVVVMPRWTVDERLPAGERKTFQPTPKQMLYGTRATIERYEVERDASGVARRAFVVVRIRQGRQSTLSGGFVFGSMTKPLIDGELYSIDPDPNDWTGFWTKKVTEGLCEGRGNALYDRLAMPGRGTVVWPSEAAAAQRRFLDGLTHLAEMGQFVKFEPSKRDYVGAHGEAPILLVQGPPGTGKSFTTSFALFARLQGAMAADLDYRILVSCHTHAAIDVLMRNLLQARDDLALIQRRFPEIFARYFDERLLDVPLYRYRPAALLPDGIIALEERRGAGAGDPAAIDRFAARRWAVLAATPGGTYKLINERWPNDLFGHEVADCLVLDEASQLSLPIAVMAALPLKPAGAVVVVGDHRQMPPIVKHDWMSERRRTFREFKAFESLFLTLLEQDPRPALIQFSESFRLHRDMAAFLGEEIYRRDGIDFRSNRVWRLNGANPDDPFVAAALSIDHPLTVIVHDERSSQLSNAFERDLIVSIARELTDVAVYGDEESDGFGVVVPHRAQRAALKSVFLDFPDTVGRKPVIVDTVERFQGDEREVIIVSATESDPSYLLAASGFLLEPRRLTVALSRAKRKLILVASRSIFELFSPDEETFANAQLWKDLLRRTCTVPLWAGERLGHHVEVWGNNGVAQL